MQKLGIFSFRDYFHKLRIPIIICTILGAAIGAAYYQFKGLIFGALLGLTAPAALIWICVTLFVVAIYLLVFCAAWVVIYYIACWLLDS